MWVGFFKQGFKTMGFCCTSGLIFRPKLKYLLSPTPIQLPLSGSEFALQTRLPAVADSFILTVGFRRE